MDKKTTALIICGIVIVCLVGYISYNYIYSKVYQQGFSDGQSIIIQNIQQTGNIPIINQQGNETKINWIPLNQLCG